MNKRVLTAVLRGVLSILILFAGFTLTKKLISSRKPAPQVSIPEQALRVDVVSASHKDVPVDIEGLGEVHSRDVVQIAAEIPGRVMHVHPSLEMGGVIPAGEVLFEIDSRDVQARHDQSTATASQYKNTIARLKKQFTIDKERLNTFKRTKDLAKEEFKRVENLYTNDKVGTQSQVDKAEMGFNNANDAFAQLSQSVDLFPIRISEAEDSLASSSAMVTMAQTDIERTKVSVSFNARVKTVSLEEGQYVSPGMSVITLANDSILEISVSLDSKLASNWLNFESTKSSSNSAWFGNLEQVGVDVSWGDDSAWIGTLHRVEMFDKETRTINVIVRIPAQSALKPTRGSQSLVEGMFCKVTIPGKIAERVVELPLESVSFSKDNEGYRTAYLARESADDGQLRLVSVKVRESHIAGESIFINEGLNEGDQVITTRLINPLANSLLNTEQFDATETD